MKIQFKTDNAAFEEDAWAETIRILHDIAEKLRQHQDNGIIMDVNGNRIGQWTL
jgi:hypothetical protein